MFLAIKEIKHEKLRYGLIVLMIALVAYLIFILSGLASGLAGQNTQAIKSWHAQSILLNKDSNTNIGQSYVLSDQINKSELTSKDAYLGQASGIVKSNGHPSLSASYIGIDSDQFVFKGVRITDGKKTINDNNVIVDEQFRQKGYKLGDDIKFNNLNKKFEIVGFTKNAKFNISPVVYGNLKNWQYVKNMGNNVKASAIISENLSTSIDNNNLKNYSISTFINNLPGYTAQVQTFTFMIAFLMIISLIVIAVFLYILTIQKLSNYAVLRAQGVPALFLIRALIVQSLILVLSGLIISIVLTVLTAIFIPTSVPIDFNIKLLSLVSLGLILTSILGTIIPIRTIVKVDPVTVIGG